jgi:hypothetical protein
MTSFLHWVQIDASAAAKAEQALNEDLEGEVRDEIGFMAIHHAFSNRFFPGTSVLHTRLRYIFFIPGLMQQVAADGGGASLGDRLRRAEAGVKDQLKATKAGRGIIGSRSHLGRMPSQLPSAAYWNALQLWGFVRPYRDKTYPTRQEALKTLVEVSSARRRNSRDDDGVATNDRAGPFLDSLAAACVQAVAGKDELSFELEADERRLYVETIGNASEHVRSSLFARLMRSAVDLPEPGLVRYDIADEWPDWIINQCNPDERKALKLASDAAAIVCIGRAVYAAMVQELRQMDGVTSGETDHREFLKQAIRDYGVAARRLSIADLRSAMANDPMPEPLDNVLVKTQAWLESGRHKQFMELCADYSAAETPRKLERSRLRKADYKRRLEWNPDDFSRAAPLHYRLARVHQLVWDMQP